MINITLSDGVIKQFPSGVTAEEIAKSISPSLAKKAVAVEVNGSLVDIYIPINHDASVKIITTDSKEGLEIIRHDAAHIIAQAVKELFPETQVTIGPVIEDGFYYDFARDIPFTISDLQVIEKKMQEIVTRNDTVRREVWSRNAAIEFFAQQGEKYKVSIIQELPEAEEITLYRQGNFVDLCRGPHAPSTSHVKHFKLMKVAGAYWRGNSKNTMLQRIYGTAWSTKADLDAYLYRITEAQKRDHRKLGRELDLFHFQDEAQGMPFWHDKGWTIFKIVREYISNKIQRAGYVEVNTPIILSQKLWEQSGHWEKFRENMFTVGTEVTDVDTNTLTTEHKCSTSASAGKAVNIAKADTKTCSFAIKPMNCPAHIQIFNYALRSYRDLPLRMAEFGACHRYEPSGSLYGLMRARGFTQDDAHIFCTEEQITDETIQFCQLLNQVYADFGFLDIKIKFSDRPSKRAGTNEVWDKAEKALLHAIQTLGAEYSINSGEGAFYGPKLEFILKDAIGREWQCGTLQVDFVLPERLNAYYVNSEGSKQRPVILHRAILGSLERFIGILIEHYAGKLPIWLAPVQVAVLSITDESIAYAKDVYQKLTDSSVRTKLDITNQKINYKIRHFSLAKVPVIAVIGKKEVDSKKIVIRKLDSDVQKTIDVEELINYIRENDKINIIK